MGAANIYVRGGIPALVSDATSGTINTTSEHHWRGRVVDDNGNEAYGIGNWLRFENTAGNPIRLSFSKADADADIAITVASGAVVEMPVEIGRFFTRSGTASQSFVALVTMRRG